jgi:hypothetical protein
MRRQRARCLRNRPRQTASQPRRLSHHRPTGRRASRPSHRQPARQANRSYTSIPMIWPISMNSTLAARPSAAKPASRGRMQPPQTRRRTSPTIAHSARVTCQGISNPGCALSNPGHCHCAVSGPPRSLSLPSRTSAMASTLKRAPCCEPAETCDGTPIRNSLDGPLGQAQSRTIPKSDRSRCRLNLRRVPLGRVAELGRWRHHRTPLVKGEPRRRRHGCNPCGPADACRALMPHRRRAPSFRAGLSAVIRRMSLGCHQTVRCAPNRLGQNSRECNHTIIVTNTLAIVTRKFSHRYQQVSDNRLFRLHISIASPCERAGPDALSQKFIRHLNLLCAVFRTGVARRQR